MIIIEIIWQRERERTYGRARERKEWRECERECEKQIIIRTLKKRECRECCIARL